MVAQSLKTLFLLSAAFSGVSAFWRMECRGRSGLARIDPMMSLGKVAQHAHTIHGSSGFGESATYDSLMAGNCTSCAVAQDLSAYWTPAMYFQHSDGTFEIVNQVGGMLAYYLLRDPENNVQAFPKDFRMIAGNSLRRNYTVGDVTQPDPPQSNWASLGQTTQDDLAQRALGFNCLNYAITPEASLYRHFMPDKSYLDANCPDGLRLELAFPSCWDGVHTDSSNHQSHMAYPDLVQDGSCPSGFEVRLVTLFYETIWDTHAFNGVDGSFVIANGDPTGYGYHGDFMTGWDVDFLQSAVDQCTNESGLISDCAPFTIQDEDTQNQCKLETMPTILAVENLVGGADGILSALPGNVQIQAGPQQATLGAAAATTADPTSTYSAPVLTYTPASSSSYPGGGIFLQSSSSTSVVLPTATKESIEAVSSAQSSPATTATPTSATSPGASYEVVSTEYRTVGNKIEEIIWEEAVVYVTEGAVPTTAAGIFNKSGHQKKSHQKRDHLFRHRHHGRR